MEGLFGGTYSPMFGYSTAFTSGGPWFGDASRFFALVLGATAERMRLGVTIVFAACWMLLVYAPIAHWVWHPNGWLAKMGDMDFAGSTVVHIASGFTGLVAAIVLGPRRGFGKEPMIPHNLMLTVLGAGLLWAGWFGFNTGSAFEASPRAARAAGHAGGGLFRRHVVGLLRIRAPAWTIRLTCLPCTASAA